MARKLDIYLRDILEACDLIATDLSGVALEDFQNNRLLQDATIRRFEIIGEAVKRVPDAVREKHPEVEWQNAAAFRDVLIHDYPEIVVDEVYHTALHDLPSFRASIERVLKHL